MSILLAAGEELSHIWRQVKRVALLFWLSYALTGTGLSADRRLAFERGEAVEVANLDVTLIRQLAVGIFPAISSDATRVAFTAVEKLGTNSVRRIAVTEIALGKTAIFNDIPSDNSYGASWSPNGKWIAFALRSDGAWHLGMIKPDGTGFNFIRKGASDEPARYSPSWARDGLSIFCQDTTNLYRLTLDGSVLAQWKIAQIVPNGGMSSDGRIDVSPDGKRLLLSVDMDEDYVRKDWDGPPPALWSFDLETQIAVRLTSRGLFAWDACWLDNDNILFVSQAVGQKEPAIYRMSARQKNLKQLLGGARRPSVSLPNGLIQ